MGNTGNAYPWGSANDENKRPEVNHERIYPGPERVTKYSPAADSPFGVADLVGNVWQYTDEFQDEHTRSVLLKGSSLYNPVLSSDFPASSQVGNWYFPPAREVNKHNKMMLMGDSYERASTLGFRCVANHVSGQSGPHPFAASRSS